MLGRIPFAIGYYYGLNFIEGAPWMFFVLPAAYALHIFMFNVGFFKNMSRVIDAEYRGQEIGTRNMFSELMRFAGPLTGGVLIATLGFNAIFVVGSVFFFVSILPLFFFPHYNISSGITLATLWNFFKRKEFYRFHVSEAGYSMQWLVGSVLWGLLMFFILGDVTRFGGLMSAGIFLGALLSYGVGYFADNGMRVWILRAAAGATALIWVARIAVETPLLVVVSQLAGSITMAALLVPWSSFYYQYANNTRPAGCFIIAQELIYHVARLILVPILVAAALFMPFSMLVALGFVFAAGANVLFFLLREPKKNL